MKQKLSEHLKLWRIERPSEWKMDEFIREAEQLQKQGEKLWERLKEHQDELTSAQERSAAQFEEIKLLMDERDNLKKRQLPDGWHVGETRDGHLIAIHLAMTTRGTDNDLIIADSEKLKPSTINYDDVLKQKIEEQNKIATMYREQRLARKQANFLKRQPKRKPNP